MVITRLLRRIERAGFFVFFFGMFLAAIGITQDVAILRNVGLAILVLTLLTVIVKSLRDVSGKPRRPQFADEPKQEARPQRQPPERLPGRPGDPDTV